MEEVLITAERNGAASSKYSNDKDEKIIGLEFDIFDKPVNIQVGVSSEKTSLADIVPLAWSISAKITELTVEKICEEGEEVPCRLGCSSCCGYLVPVSVPEAFWIMERILEMPEGQRFMLQRCLPAAKRILSQRPPKFLTEQSRNILSTGEAERNKVANWYRQLKLQCPFEYRKSCAIYGLRPLACREHFVKGSARGCREERGTAEVIEMPVRMLNVLGQLASELESKDVETVMMPLIPAWYEKNKQRGERKYPAAAMVERLGEILRATTESTVFSF